MRSHPPRSPSRRRERPLGGLLTAFVLVVAATACDTLDPLLGSEGAADEGAADEGATEVEAAEDTDQDASQGSPPESNATGSDATESTPVEDDSDEPRETSSVAGGVGGGTVTIDGTTIGLDRTVLCEPPDNVAGEGTGVQEMIDSMETLNLHSPSDVGNLAIYLADLGFRSLEISWDQGPGEARYTANFGDLEGDGSWFDSESMDEPEHDPLQVTGDRATGTATLQETGGNSPIEVSYDLPIPDEATC